MLESSIAKDHPSHPLFDAVESKVWKTVTIHQFADGVEVFIDEAKRTWSDGAGFEDIEQQDRAARGKGDRERSIERAARRAKTKVRRLCKAMQADCMLTLTYRENMRDPERLERDFKAFRKRLEQLGPFQYVATIEKQERGALHLHIACQHFPKWMTNEEGVRVKSYNLIRSMWRRVVGRDNGNVDLTKPRGRNSAHRIASYIAKYVSKKVEDAELNAKSYWASRDIQLPKPERYWFPDSMTTWDIVADLARQFVAKGYTDIAQFADPLNQFHWFSASTPPKWLH